MSHSAIMPPPGRLYDEYGNARIHDLVPWIQPYLGKFCVPIFVSVRWLDKEPTDALDPLECDPEVDVLHPEAWQIVFRYVLDCKHGVKMHGWIRPTAWFRMQNYAGAVACLFIHAQDLANLASRRYEGVAKVAFPDIWTYQELKDSGIECCLTSAHRKFYDMLQLQFKKVQETE